MGTEYRSVFDTVYDIGVVGLGYAGLAAAISATKAGKRVVLVDDKGRGDLVWESGRAFYGKIGDQDNPAWQEWIIRLQQKGGISAGMINGAIAEVVASRWLCESPVIPLYYSIPVACESDDSGLLSGIVIASKSGINRVQARQWIDATDIGLIGVMSKTNHHLPAKAFQGTIHLYATDWSEERLSWQTDLYTASMIHGITPREKQLQLQWNGTADDWWDLVPHALAELSSRSGVYASSGLVSHMSIEPMPLDSKNTIGDRLPTNCMQVWKEDIPSALCTRFRTGASSVSFVRLMSGPIAFVYDPIG